MADSNQPQTWFCIIQSQDVYHKQLVVIKGLLTEVLQKLQNSQELSAASISVYALENCTLSPNCERVFIELARLGTVLKEVAVLRYDRDLSRWKDAFTQVFDNLPLEQREVELKLLATRVLGELKVLEVQKQINPPKEEDK